jgi:Cu(I)/Ag(I) efflux system membrane fusion protein
MKATPMFRATTLAAAAFALAAVFAGAGWWFGRHQGASTAHAGHGAAAPSAGAASAAAPAADPSSWTIAQGEEATRRHVREGIKAGDIDPLVGRKVLHYMDPMVPGKTFEAPGKSPFMDMMLVPRYAGGGDGDAGTVSISPRLQQNLGLKTALVVAGSLTSELSAVGNIAWNEREQVVLASRAMGFVERLHVRATQDPVAAGAPLADIYVPDWVAAQEEYLALAREAARRGAGAGAGGGGSSAKSGDTGQGADLTVLLDAARQRLRQVGMDAAQIERVMQSATVQPRFTLTASREGIVSELMAREGATVMPGMPLMRIQGTSVVWAEGQFPESQAAGLRPGMAASVTSAALPGRSFEGRVQALLPEVDAATRTIKVRVELANPGRALVPGLLVQMRLTPAAGKRVLLVPSDAVIQTGRRSVVLLAEEGGRYRPVQVQTGTESDERIEIVSGLTAGQRVVLSAQFLIDSEASLRGLEAKLNQGAPQSFKTDAVVDCIEGDTASLTHPPIPALKWPEMTMDFKLPPPAERPRGLKKGERIEIEFRQVDGDVPQITRLRRASAASMPGAKPGGKP